MKAEEENRIAKFSSFYNSHKLNWFMGTLSINQTHPKLISSHAFCTYIQVRHWSESLLVTVNKYLDLNTIQNSFVLPLLHELETRGELSEPQVRMLMRVASARGDAVACKFVLPALLQAVDKKIKVCIFFLFFKTTRKNLGI